MLGTADADVAAVWFFGRKGWRADILPPCQACATR